MREEVVEILKKALKKTGFDISEQEINSRLEVPKKYELGDYAFPCFFLAQQTNQDPHEIAMRIRSAIGNAPIIDFDNIYVEGPYVNFVANRKLFAQKVIWEVLSKKKKYGIKKSFAKPKKKIVVEFSSPNIAKRFGIGHLRSTIIGNSIANLFESVGHKVTRINYLGDWGTQFGKLIFGFKQFGDLDKLEQDPVAHLEELYQKVSKNKKYDDEARYWFKKLEEGDSDAVTLWRAFRELSLDRFKEIYKALGIEFDDFLFESDYNKKMNRIIDELKEKNLLKQSQGALVVDLKKYGLGVALIKKSDGTTLYATRDIASAIERYKKYKFDLMIYETGQEQKLHFKQVFKILELMGYGWAKNCVHISHGLYLDRNKKKFSTRKGKLVYVEDIFNETKSLAKKEIAKRFPNLSKQELENRAHKIAIAALFYGDLKNNLSNDIVFDLNNFVSFEGNTGPYIMYSYARASSISRKVSLDKKFELPEDLHFLEFNLLKKIDHYSNVLEKALTSLSPSVIANYCFELSQIFNEFYHQCPVINDEKESFRVAIVDSFRQVIRNAMNVLGISLLEEM